MTDFTLAFALGFGCGGTLIWFFKTRIQALVIDANKLSAQLHVEAEAVAALIKKA